MQPEPAKPTALRALQILECFSEHTPELSLTEIGELLSLNVGTVHRLVNGLQQAGYLTKKPDQSGKFRLGLRPLGIAKVILNSLPVRLEAVPFLRELAAETGANASLAIREGSEVVYVERVSEAQASDPYFHSGRRAPAYCTALGKIMLAYSTAESVKLVIEDGLIPLTATTIVDQEVLWAELEQVRSRGYACDNAEYMQGTHCVAGPIFDARGTVVAALSLSMGTSFIASGQVHDHLKALLKVCARISHRLGFSLYEPTSPFRHSP